MAQRLDRLNRSAEIAEESNKRPVVRGGPIGIAWRRTAHARATSACVQGCSLSRHAGRAVYNASRLFLTIAVAIRAECLL